MVAIDPLPFATINMHFMGKVLALDASIDFDMRLREQGQQALFPTEDLIIPGSIGKLRKSVSAIHAIPTNSSLSLNRQRLFDACILVAQIDCRGREKDFVERIRRDRVSPMFEVRITELAKLASIPGKNYQRIYDELDALYEMSLTWNIAAEDKQVEWEMKSHFFSSIGFGKGYKRGLVRFSFDPAVLEILLEPSQWANLSLQVMRDLKSGASYALYQNAWRYIGTQNKVTAALPTTTWIELLIGKSNYVVEENGSKRVQNYKDFKRRVLVDAISRVNEIQALSHTLKLKEHLSGRRVSRIQFEFIPKDQPSLGLPLTWSPDVLKVLADLGYDNQGVASLSERHSQEIVREALLHLDAAVSKLKAKGQRVTNQQAYFEGILRNLSGGAAEDALAPEQIESDLRQQAAEKAATDRHAKAQEAFNEHQRNCFSKWLFWIPPEMRDALVADCLAHGEISPLNRKMLQRGITPENKTGIAMLRVWLNKERQDLVELIYPEPQDRTLENWMAWKLEVAEK